MFEVYRQSCYVYSNKDATILTTFYFFTIKDALFFNTLRNTYEDNLFNCIIFSKTYSGKQYVLQNILKRLSNITPA